MGRDVIQIQLTPEERSLLLRHGYPFDDVCRELEARVKSPRIETVPVDRFELEQLICQLCISIKELDGGRLQDRLNDLCDRLEAIEKSGDGLLETF